MVLVRFLNPVLMVVVGLGVGVLVAGQRQNAWRVYGVGVWTFVLSQVLHIPFNSWVLSGWLEGRSSRGWDLVVTAVALGLSAGVFEEVARYFAYRFALKDARSWRDGLIFGAGHGGVEAVLLGGFAFYAVVQLFVLRGDGSALLLDIPVDDLSRVQAQVAAFWSLPWYAVLLGALERVFAIAFHLSAAILVLQVFQRGRAIWLLYAVLWHALIDAAVVYVSGVWGVYWAEGVVGVLALVSLGLVWWLREDDPAAPETGADDDAPVELERVEVSREQIDSSRFT